MTLTVFAGHEDHTNRDDTAHDLCVMRRAARHSLITQLQTLRFLEQSIDEAFIARNGGQVAQLLELKHQIPTTGDCRERLSQRRSQFI